MQFIDHTAPADEAAYLLDLAVRFARDRVERLEKTLARARRALLNREKELARYQATGETPKRKGFQRDLAEVAARFVQRWTAFKPGVQGKGEA